jgi:hypothetical protein
MAADIVAAVMASAASVPAMASVLVASSTVPFAVVVAADRAAVSVEAGTSPRAPDLRPVEPSGTAPIPAAVTPAAADDAAAADAEST